MKLAKDTTPTAKRQGWKQDILGNRKRELRINDFFRMSYRRLSMTAVSSDECEQYSYLGPALKLLPEQYAFGTRGFLDLTAHMKNLGLLNNKPGYTISPVIATYANQQQRKAVITQAVRSDRLSQ
jgi:hypothetical protein